jgi:hypothetical protein
VLAQPLIVAAPTSVSIAAHQVLLRLNGGISTGVVYSAATVAVVYMAQYYLVLVAALRLDGSLILH